MVPYFEQQGALAMRRSVSHAWLQLMFRCSGAMTILMFLSLHVDNIGNIQHNDMHNFTLRMVK